MSWRIKIIIFTTFFPLMAFAQLPNPGPGSWGELGMNIFNFVLNLVIPAAIIVIIWSGIQFMTAGGNEARVTKAKGTLTWAIIGLVVALLAKGLMNLIANVLGG